MAKRKNNPSTGMQGWNVYDGAEKIDTVFFIEGMTSEEVKRSLIDHDNYPGNITVRKQPRARIVNPAQDDWNEPKSRASQITKKAPSKRLLLRRMKNTKKGYFPNPGKTYVMLYAVVVTLNKKNTIVCVSKNSVHASQIAQLLQLEDAIAGARFHVTNIRSSDYV